ncbi:MAG TPA: NADH-quinone oxidoreductase subunit L [Candidatus Omnitrophota bacterium]|nr:NADH-quinone oxidoreductase subunit L [Candidatus Omnitrophota bacterium]HPD84233.1 NADH-quinone oxidoreductase subunit L [Candidatus Omnitrophota bacterium]HRZ03089.1 NADH-quinone oxidoreductase subunit L [Candidatus Omnitrophota bacterium]
MDNILLLPILVPAVSGILMLLIRKTRGIKEIATFFVATANLLIAVMLFRKELDFTLPWAGFGMEFSLRLYHFSSFILLATGFFGFLIALYCTTFMREKGALNQFYSYLLISIALVNGAVLSDNLVLMLFFWEGLLVTLFGMIFIGGKDSFRTATKAFIIVGISDLCMMVGIGITAHLAGTLTISKINLPVDALGSVAFVLLMIGAISKAGAMPFHSWIPDAAKDAPLPFMAFLPAALEKLLGIYFLARISLDMFKLDASSWLSPLLMIIGCITILLAVMMALIQKDYKKLLSYHAISQVGYMILGIGTCVPVGIVGGLFHMINHALYKCCLFLSGGSVEKQAGTTDLEKLGGLGIKMPVTFGCFIVAAASISGVPPFNGFFSKELIYDGALERGWIFYAMAVAGSFFTAASFLKLGHAAFLGKINDANKSVKEASWPMLIPMVMIASLCVLFGLYNALPLNNLIQPILGEHRLEGHNFSGMPTNAFLVIMTVLVLAAALLNHYLGFKKQGSGIKAVDHIHYAPVLHPIYDRAEKRFFDPFDIGMRVAGWAAKMIWYVDRVIDWLYDGFSVGMTYALSIGIRRAHTGNYSVYIIWSLVGLMVIIFLAVR